MATDKANIESVENANETTFQKIVQKSTRFLRATVQKLVPEAVRPNTSTIAKYLFIGLAIRFFLMPIACLPADVIGNSFFAYVIEHYGMYNYFLYYSAPSPPLEAYLLAGFFRFYELFSPGFFFGKYVTFAPQNYPILYKDFPGENYPFFQILMTDPNVFPFLFLAKLPSLIFDIAIAFFLLRLFTDSGKALLAFKVWILNPITLYTIYIMGEIEVIPLFFALYGCYQIYVNKPKKGIVLLGLTAAMKPIALLLIPLACFAAIKKSMRQALRYLILGAVPLLVVIFFTYLVSQFHQGYQFVDRSTISVWLRTSVEFSAHAPTLIEFIDVIYAFPLIYAIILGLTLFSRQMDNQKVWELFTCMFGAMFAFNLFHPHWFVWYTLFALIFAVMSDRRFLHLNYLIYAFFIIYTLYWPTLQFALFMPVAPTIYQLGGVRMLMEKAGLPGILLLNTARSAFSGFLIFSCILSLKHAYFGKGSVSHVIQSLKTKFGSQNPE
jgi:hypothetical protein